MSETDPVFYEDAHGNMVTRSRAVIGGTVFPVANITSVRSQVKASQVPLAVIVFIVGLAMLFMNPPTLGVIFIAIGALLTIKGRQRYSVIIGTSAREQTALESSDRTVARAVIDALNKAIASR